ncbi:MAG: hypothetical protein LBJ73_02445 [Rickettsiales bacterium]|jgi:hypothetical protein|nr:hypothetical protein [Rickettsiales bacterium]
MKKETAYLVIAGIMVAAPAVADVASTTYVDRIVDGIMKPDGVNELVGSDNKINSAYLDIGMVGSTITGYLTGSGSYVLVGSTADGPYGAKNLTGIGSEIAGYGSTTYATDVLVGSGQAASWMKISGLGSMFSSDSIPGIAIGSGIRGSYISVPTSSTGSRNVLIGYGSTLGHYSGVSADVLGSYISGMQGSTIAFAGNTGTFNVIASPQGSYYSGMTAGAVGSYLSSGMVGSMIGGFGTTGSGDYILVGSGNGTYGGQTVGALATKLGSIIGSNISGVQGSTIAFYGSTGNFNVIASPSGSYYSGMTASQVGSYLASGIPGRMISGFNNTGSGSWVLVGSGSGVGPYGGQSISAFGSTLGSQIQGYTMMATGAVAATGVAYLPVFYNGALVGVPFSDFSAIMDIALPVKP